MTKFILNRPYDGKNYSRKKVILTTLKWFVLLVICATLLRILCVAIYMSNGINPMELTKFGGDPTVHREYASWRIVAQLMIMAPLLEEIIFRLGLSFKRRTVSLWLGLLPIVCAFYFLHCKTWYILLGMFIIGVFLYWLTFSRTSDEQWIKWRKRYIVPAMYISAIAFGVVHFLAFSVLNLQVFPFALATILVPMAAGCAFTYARVNLGFWWGVLLHCINNIPAILVIVSSMNQ